MWQQLLSKSHHVRVYIAYSDFEALFFFFLFGRGGWGGGWRGELWVSGGEYGQGVGVAGVILGLLV